LAENEYVLRTFTKGDKEAVRALVKRVFADNARSLLGGEPWEWKYLRNPNFDPSLVAVAERKGRIVGCNHWLLRDIKLTGLLVCKAILCGDIAVDPNHRKRGLGKSLLLFLRSSGLSNAKGSVLSYMFSTPELGKRLYGPTVGYIRMSTSTVRYVKRWSWKNVVRKVNEINTNPSQEDGLGKRATDDFAVVFHVIGAPPLTIVVNGGRIKALEESIVEARLKITTDLATFTALSRREKRVRRLLKAVLGRKLKVKGSLLSIIKLYQNLHRLEEIFR
jgi:predicted N-acetyltransferase YhbS